MGGLINDLHIIERDGPVISGNIEVNVHTRFRLIACTDSGEKNSTVAVSVFIFPGNLKNVSGKITRHVVIISVCGGVDVFETNPWRERESVGKEDNIFSKQRSVSVWEPI